MTPDVTEYIAARPTWQADVCTGLRGLVHDTIPDIEERLQYGKPHYLKNGHYAAVISASKDKVSFMLFNAQNIDVIKGVLRAMGNGERKTVDIREDQEPDYDQLADLLNNTAADL